MKMLLCKDIMLGAMCAENLDVKLSQRWQALRTERFADFIDKAAQLNAGYVALFGHIFGQDRVSESVIDSLFDDVKEDKNVQVLLFVDHLEYNRINYRDDIPENLHMICMDIADTYLDDNVAVRIEKRVAEIQLNDNDPITVSMNANGTYWVSGIDAADKALLSLEPIGFEDDDNETFGYSVLEWAKEEIVNYQDTLEQMFQYDTMEIKLTPADDQKEIYAKITKTMSQLGRDTFLRVDVKGTSAFAVMLSADALKAQLQSKVFYAEVYVNTIMDIDEEAFENDISLRSEFVRLALQDDSLSESERNRLICCGWNVLNGKEVTEG
jgi:23S rRNA pseudoU1915 N3-methylase RlmH